jgi:glycosyltransferase involved in cell wall biosynthesis
MSQSYRDFEWVIANDGSDDETVKIVTELASRSDFPVTLIDASRRIGKSRMDNEAVAVARGDFILWCDSDDILMPNALEVLMTTWNSIPLNERNNFCGVTALCDTKKGILGNAYPTDEYTDISFNDLYNILRSDLVIFTKSELLKTTRFLEVDFLISESSVWSVIGVKTTRFIPQVLERKSYGEAHCLSFSGLMEYNRGKAFSLAITQKYQKELLPLRERIQRAINYIRYCIHGEMDYIEAIKMWRGGILTNLGFLVITPISISLALKDQIQGKVRKTHREFLAAKQSVQIDIRVLRQ